MIIDNEPRSRKNFFRWNYPRVLKHGQRRKPVLKSEGEERKGMKKLAALLQICRNSARTGCKKTKAALKIENGLHALNRRPGVVKQLDFEFICLELFTYS